MNQPIAAAGRGRPLLDLGGSFLSDLQLHYLERATNADCPSSARVDRSSAKIGLSSGLGRARTLSRADAASCRTSG